MAATLQEAFVAKRRGEATEEHIQLIRDHQRKLDKLSTKIYWPSHDELQAYKERYRASDDKRFSAWLLKLIRHGASQSRRTIHEWAEMKERIERAERRLDQTLGLLNEYREKTNRYECERDQARHQLTQLQARIEGLADQAEARRRP